MFQYYDDIDYLEDREGLLEDREGLLEDDYLDDLYDEDLFNEEVRFYRSIGQQGL